MLARSASAFVVAALATSCLGLRPMDGESLSHDHVAWIMATAPGTGAWVGSLEADEAWVDAFEDDAGKLVLIARCPEEKRIVYTSFPGFWEAESEQPSGALREAHFQWFDDGSGGGSITCDPPPIAPTLRRLEFPTASTLPIYVHFSDPAFNSYCPASFKGELRFRRRPDAMVR